MVNGKNPLGKKKPTNRNIPYTEKVNQAAPTTYINNINIKQIELLLETILSFFLKQKV